MMKAVIRRLLQNVPQRRVVPHPACVSMEARSEAEVRLAAYRLAPRERAEAISIEGLIRELVSLNTPALFLNIVQPGARTHVGLWPWDGRSIRFRGENYFVDAGAGSAEGIEAFIEVPFARVTTLYPTAPDHPVYIVSIEHQGGTVYRGDFPAYLTHLTLRVNGRVVTRAERLLHERGPQVWAA